MQLLSSDNLAEALDDTNATLQIQDAVQNRMQN